MASVSAARLRGPGYHFIQNKGIGHAFHSRTGVTMGNIGDPIATLVPTVGTVGPGFATDINALLEEFKLRLASLVSLAEMAPLAASSIIGNNTGAAASPTAMTVAQVKSLLAYLYSDIGGSVPGSATPAYVGDVTKPAASTVTAIAASAVTNAKLANAPTLTVKGNATGGSAAPTDLTQGQLTSLVNQFTTALKGLVPAPGTVTGKVLSDNGTWVAAGGGGGLTHQQIMGRIALGF
jgi:hypothetical protein